MGDGELPAVLDVDSRRQWHLACDATPGVHRLSLRATDRLGEVLTAARAPGTPDGATGRHVAVVHVEDGGGAR